MLLRCVRFCQCLQHPRKLELDCSVSKPEVYSPSSCLLPPTNSHLAPNHQGHKVGSTVKSKEGMKPPSEESAEWSGWLPHKLSCYWTASDTPASRDVGHVCGGWMATTAPWDTEICDMSLPMISFTERGKKRRSIVFLQFFERLARRSFETNE